METNTSTLAITIAPCSAIIVWGSEMPPESGNGCNHGEDGAKIEITPPTRAQKTRVERIRAIDARRERDNARGADLFLPYAPVGKDGSQLADERGVFDAMPDVADVDRLVRQIGTVCDDWPGGESEVPLPFRFRLVLAMGVVRLHHPYLSETPVMGYAILPTEPIQFVGWRGELAILIHKTNVAAKSMARMR
jgi:hypothetical protein